MQELNKPVMVRKTNWVLDAGVKGFFDHVAHDWLMRFLNWRIDDTTLLKLIKRFLKVGTVEEGKLSESEVGTPQGLEKIVFLRRPSRETLSERVVTVTTDLV